MIAQVSPRPAAARPATIPARMAAYMVEREAATGGVTREDLLLEFTGEEIDTHGEAAKALARKAARQ